MRVADCSAARSRSEVSGSGRWLPHKHRIGFGFLFLIAPRRRPNRSLRDDRVSDAGHGVGEQGSVDANARLSARRDQSQPPSRNPSRAGPPNPTFEPLIQLGSHRTCRCPEPAVSPRSEVSPPIRSQSSISSAVGPQSAAVSPQSAIRRKKGRLARSRPFLRVGLTRPPRACAWFAAAPRFSCD